MDFFFSSRRRHTRSLCDWSSDVCSSDLNRGSFGEGIKGNAVKLAQIPEHPAVEIARAALGDGIDNTSRGAPEFCAVIAVGYLKLLDGLPAVGVSDTRPSARLRGYGLAIVGAVHRVVVVKA